MKTILITGGSGFIGTNLIDLLLQKEIYKIINFDKNPPLDQRHISYWHNGNIMDEKKTEAFFQINKPDIVIHLAARTDTLSNKLDDYNENHVGTKNLLQVIKRCLSIERVIITSTQYVYKSTEQAFPLSSVDYKPHTVYGESKVLTEQYTHNANLECVWTIVRPANIWGPWHMRYPVELWKIIDKGYYFHPASHPVIRTYGYVKNIVHQIYQMVISDPSIVNKKTFYVGDAPIDSYEWLNSISMRLKGKRLKRVPTGIFKTIAEGGDFLRKIKIPFPLYSERFRNMIEDYPAPTDITINTFGVANDNLDENVIETINWLKGEGKSYFEYWKNRGK
ncbi:NAD-dependent epimerase/dehydratase family protein [Spirosoma litoris]